MGLLQRNIRKKDEVKPILIKKTYETYFKNVFKQRNSNKTFQLPAWMKKLETRHTVFDLAPPSYRETTKIIHKTNSGGSQCPHDKISIIILKRCPILRTYIHKILRHCLLHRIFSRCWKYAFTILTYKKKSNIEPSNFRPNTLQTVLAKIYSVLILKRMEKHIWNNWAYRITESYRQPRKKQTTPNYCYIIRPKKCVWWGWPSVTTKSVRILRSTSRNKNTNNRLLW